MSIFVSIITSCVNNPPDQSLAIEIVGVGGSRGGVWGGGGVVGGFSGGGGDGGGGDGVGIDGGGVVGGGVSGGGNAGGGKLGDPCAISHGVAANPSSVTTNQ